MSKGNVTPIKTKKDLLQQAKDELEQETEGKAIKVLKEKLRELQRAELIVDNLKEEITLIQEKIKRGDVDDL